MKKIFGILLVTIIFYVLLVNIAQAEVHKDIKSDKGIINFGIGASTYGWLSTNISCGFKDQNYFYTFKLINNNESLLSLHSDYSSELGFLWGKVWDINYLMASCGAGISLLEFTHQYSISNGSSGGGWFSFMSTKGYDWYDEKRYTIGIPLEAQIILKPIPLLGLGIVSFANLNFVKSYLGAVLVLNIHF